MPLVLLTSTGMPPTRVFFSIVGIVVIIVGAYYATYYIGKKAQGTSRGRNRNIALLDRFAISRDKSFCIVQIAGKIYIVGVTNQTMTLLDSMDAEDFSKAGGYSGQAPPWSARPADAPPGYYQSGGLVAAFASFLAKNVFKRKTPKSGAETDAETPSGGGGASDDSGASFKTSMENARKKASAKPDDTQAGRADDPEDDG
jgi:flagellar biogenesis protein FliO